MTRRSLFASIAAAFAAKPAAKAVTKPAPTFVISKIDLASKTVTLSSGSIKASQISSIPKCKITCGTLITD